MICTSKQLKDKVRNISNGDNEVAKAMIRIFMMERFLERVALSRYRNNFILKGGMLVASIVGVNMRTTMDIDATVDALPLTESDAERIVKEICDLRIDDGVIFSITSVKKIMSDFEYPGIRMALEICLDRMRQTIKLDISTDDAITPKAVIYEYNLLFEERAIYLLSYNTETLLAEKMQTIISRGVANTRMRDFYDVCEISKIARGGIDYAILNEAFKATCNKRETIFTKTIIEHTLARINEDENMAVLWERFSKSNFYVVNLTWREVLSEVIKLSNML